MERTTVAHAGAVILLPLLLGGCGGGRGEQETHAIIEPQPIVRSITPTNGQETLPDLADPALGGHLTIRFGQPLRERRLLEALLVGDRDGPYLRFFDASLVAVRGSATWDPLSFSLLFTPSPGAMPPGQYTLVLSRRLLFGRHLRLNWGVEDFTSSWTVGPDAYPPRLLGTSPARNQVGGPRFADIVLSFNESLDPVTVLQGQTVEVEDASYDPPRPIPGALLLKRDGFDVVFRPDPCVGFPPATTVRVRLGAAGGLGPIRDRKGNAFEGFSYEFRTAGDAPFPDPVAVPRPGSPLAGLPGSAVFAATANAVVALDVGPAYEDLDPGAGPRPERVQRVAPGNPAGIDYRAPLEAAVRRAAEVVVDPRFDPTTLQTFLYVLDEEKARVAVVQSGTGVVEGWINLGGHPRGLGISAIGARGEPPALFVSEFRYGTITRIPLGKILPGVSACEPIVDLNVDRSLRGAFSVGRGPIGVACSPDPETGLGVVCNSLDGTITVFRTRPPEVCPMPWELATYPAGPGPFEASWGAASAGGSFLWVVGAAGAHDRDGSVNLWWTGPPGGGARPAGLVSAGTLPEGIRRPGRPFADPTAPDRCFVPETDGTSIAVLEWPTGTPVPSPTAPPRIARRLEVGLRPASFTRDARAGRLGLVALPDSGQVAVLDLEAPTQTPVLLSIPGVRGVFSAFDQ